MKFISSETVESNPEGIYRKHECSNKKYYLCKSIYNKLQSLNLKCNAENILYNRKYTISEIKESLKEWMH
jgi:hypothetical protein